MGDRAGCRSRCDHFGHHHSDRVSHLEEFEKEKAAKTRKGFEHESEQAGEAFDALYQGVAKQTVKTAAKQQQTSSSQQHCFQQNEVVNLRIGADNGLKM